MRVKRSDSYLEDKRRRGTVTLEDKNPKSCTRDRLETDTQKTCPFYCRRTLSTTLYRVGFTGRVRSGRHLIPFCLELN